MACHECAVLFVLIYNCYIIKRTSKGVSKAQCLNVLSNLWSVFWPNRAGSTATWRLWQPYELQWCEQNLLVSLSAYSKPNNGRSHEKTECWANWRNLYIHARWSKPVFGIHGTNISCVILHITLYHIALHHITTNYILLHHLKSYYIMLQHAKSLYIILLRLRLVLVPIRT